MRYLIRERFFRLGEDSDILNDAGQPVYQVDGKVLTLRDTLIVRDMAGQEVAQVRRRLIALRPTYEISSAARRPPRSASTSSRRSWTTSPLTSPARTTWR